MRIVYLGSGQIGLKCLDALAESHHEPALIVTQPARPAGRGKKKRPTPVALWAQKHNIECLESENVNDPAVVERIRAEKPDLILVIAFGQFVGKAVRDMPPKGAINVHTSLLPKYRGAAPINWAIIDGRQETGVTIITLAREMDAGDIISSVSTPIYPTDTAGSLHDRLAELAPGLLIATLADIEAGTAVYTPQDQSQVTLAPKLKKSDGVVDFACPAQTIRQKIHGLWPWPGAKADYLNCRTGKRTGVTFARVRLIEQTGQNQPGLIDENYHLCCGQGKLEIIELKPHGSHLMSFRDFVNGRRVRSGDKFVKIGE